MPVLSLLGGGSALAYGWGIAQDVKVGQWDLANMHYDPKSLAFKWTGYDSTCQYSGVNSMGYNYAGYYDFGTEFTPFGIRSLAMPTEDYLYVFHGTGSGSTDYTTVTRMDLASPDDVLGYSKGASNFQQVDIDDGTGFHNSWVNGSDVTDDGKHYVTFKAPGNSQPSYYSGIRKFDTSTDYSITSSDTQSQTFDFTSSSSSYVYGGISLKPRKMIISDRNTNTMWEYSMTADYDFSTLSSSPTTNTNMGTINGNVHDFTITPSGDAFVFTGQATSSNNPNAYDSLWWVDTSGGSISNLDFTRADSKDFRFYLNDAGTGITDTYPRGVAFNGNGTQMLVALPNQQRIAAFTIGAWDVRSDRSTTSVRSYVANGLALKPDGTRLWNVDYTGKKIHEINMSTPYDLGTATYGSDFSLVGQDNFPYTVYWKPDGTRFYIAGSQYKKVYEYSCSTAWDISTASYANKATAALSSHNFYGHTMSVDGTKLYICKSKLVSYQNYDSFIAQYSLSTAWDISTASQIGSDINVYASGNFAVTDMSFHPDGDKMFTMGSTPYTGLLQQWNLSTAWDASTAVASSTEYFDLGDGFLNNTPTMKHCWAEDGSQVFISNNNADCIYSFNVYEA